MSASGKQEERPLRVKVTSTWRETSLVARQLPPGQGRRLGSCEFFVNEPIEECDYWVVYETIEEEATAVLPKGNTILVTGEPSQVKVYDPVYLAQYGGILTCHPHVRGRWVDHRAHGYVWMLGLGLKDRKAGLYETLRDYTDLAQPVLEKPELLSAFVSGKAYIKGHLRRDAFVQRLRERLGDRLHVYGRGERPTIDKSEALLPYRYHLVVENAESPDYWTEKLSDAYLAECFPIYFGCPNIGDYFEPEMLQVIDFRNLDQAVETVIATIESDRWERQRDAVREAKRRVLEEYNIFVVLERFIARMEAERGPSQDRRRSRVRLQANPLESLPVRAILGPLRKLQRWVDPSRRLPTPDFIEKV